MRVGRKVLIIIGFIGCLALPAQASASTIFGSDLTSNPNAGCGLGPGEQCSWVSFATTTGAVTGAPVSGVLVSVRARTRLAASPTFTVRVLDRLVSLDFLNIGPEIPLPVTADATVPGHITEAAGLHHKIALGDYLSVGYQTLNATQVQHSVTGGSSSCANRLGAAMPHPVNTVQTYNGTSCNLEVLVQGTIEPDADGDLFGDETQDRCLGVAGAQDGCPPAVVKKKKCKKKKHRRSADAAKKKKCKKKKRR
jgi:hypothetical protein